MGDSKRSSKRLTREGEPSQKTEKGLEIPIPTRSEFFGALKKAAKKSLDRGRARDSGPGSSRSSQEKP
jgi:hypothetical protein